ncbi:MAG: hypothetical protein AB1656_03685, partial [Candidatus Omnitrophota bacterium]
WIRQLGLEVDIQELDRCPVRPFILSEYQLSPPKIIVYRYLPIEDCLNLTSQHAAGYYGPWYFLHIAYQFYFHLELNGFYELERRWFHRLFGLIGSIEDRAYRFSKNILGTLHSPKRFDDAVEQSFRPSSAFYSPNSDI